MENENLQESSVQTNYLGKDRYNLLVKMLGLCFDTLDTYGKDISSLENSIALFDMALEDYSVGVIEAAFKKHIKASEKYPKPVNIIEIIEGPKKPKLCGNRYNRLCQQVQDMGWDSMTDDEVTFKKAYEAQQLDYATEERLPEAIASERGGQITSGGFKRIGQVLEGEGQ